VIKYSLIVPPTALPIKDHEHVRSGTGHVPEAEALPADPFIVPFTEPGLVMKSTVHVPIPKHAPTALLKGVTLLGTKIVLVVEVAVLLRLTETFADAADAPTPHSTKVAASEHAIFRYIIPPRSEDLSSLVAAPATCRR
jgi:hypothetical protein